MFVAAMFRWNQFQCVFVQLCYNTGFCVFSDELQKMNKKMEEVKTCDIQVLTEDFLDEAENGDVMTLITKKNISSWGSDVST